MTIPSERRGSRAWPRARDERGVLEGGGRESCTRGMFGKRALGEEGGKRIEKLAKMPWSRPRVTCLLLMLAVDKRSAILDASAGEPFEGNLCS